jgi:hypothetical protein
MEFNLDLLQLIILGRVSADDSDQSEDVKIEESPRIGTEGAPLTPSGSSLRKEASGKASIRLNSTQLEALKAPASGQTPRLASARESSSATGTTPRSTPRGGGGSTPRGGSNSEESKGRKSKTLFDELSGKTGGENAMKWFEEHSTPPEREMSEAQFMQFLQSLTKIYDWEVYEILDILGMSTQIPRTSLKTALPAQIACKPNFSLLPFYKTAATLAL